MTSVSYILQVKAFLQSLPPGAMLADVGCGNGKYFGVRPDIAVLGSDRSPNLAETAARRFAALPFPEPSLDCLHPKGMVESYLLL